MSPIRLVATDLDGTLLHSDGSLSDRTRQVLADLDAMGLPVVIVTARPMRWMAPFRAVVASHGMAVVSNGAIVMDLRTGAPLEVIGIEPVDGLGMIDDIRAASPEAQFALETAEGIVREDGYVETDHVPPGSPVGPLSRVWRSPAFKILVKHPDGAEVADGEAFRRSVRDAVGDRANPTWTVEGLVEIGPRGVTKASTLSVLADRLGVAAAEVIAFGDMPNDIAMLRWAGRGCAVGNAHAEVRSAADEVVPDNDADGVARTLEMLLD